MISNAIFWFFVFLKPVFWTLFSWNYSVGTFLWATAVSAPLIIQGAKTGFRLNISQGKGWWLYFFYFILCFIASIFNNISAIFYSLILSIPFLHQALYAGKIETFKPAASGTLGALAMMLLVMFGSGIGDLSSRDTSNEIGPNTIGLTAALSAYLSYRASTATKGHNRIFWQLGAVFSFSILLLTLSKTSIAAFFLAVIFSSKPLKKVNAKTIITTVTICSILFFPYGSTLYSKIESNEITFTGRTLLWDGIVNYVSGWPILVGNGYNSSKEITQEIGFDVFGVTSFTQAHNAYFEAYLNTGVLGVAAILGMVFILFKIHFAKFRNDHSYITSRGIFIILVVRSLMEASITQPGSSDSLLFFSIFLFACRNFNFKTPLRPDEKIIQHRSDKAPIDADNVFSKTINR